MNINEFNNKILIVENNIKKYILKQINKTNKLLNIKIITLDELKKKYYFDYSKETIYYVSKKYNVIKDVAEIYIDNLYYVQEIEDKKIDFLNKIKKDLIQNNLLKENKLFKKYLSDKNIVLFNLKYVDKFYIKIFDELKKKNNVIEYNDTYQETKKMLYKANNKEEEITFVASEICKLVKCGIDINKIKLANVQNDYLYIIEKTFKLFNIPVILPTFDTIKGTLIVNKFKELFSNNINNTLEELTRYIKTEEDSKIYKQIVNIINEYTFEKDILSVKDYIFSDIDNIKCDIKQITNKVECIDIKDVIEDEYVFLINYNEGVIPTNYKDEDYLTDKLKEKLNLSTSFDKNEKENNRLIEIIKKTENLIITYSAYNLNGELYISSTYNKDLFIESNVKLNFNHSHKYNKLKLISEKDENKKFGTITQNLIDLMTHYKNEEYLTYDNKFKGINKEKLNNYLKNKLTLSYTSMNSYYECSFKYYLDYILKIGKREETFELVIGNIFHNILSKVFNEEETIDELWNEELSKQTYEFNNSDKYFLNKLKDELILIVETIKKQLTYTSLTKTMYEKEIIVNVNENLNITFKGFIDKIMYESFNGETIVAIIDYKTGNPNLNINNIPYGLDMQLPVYIYLLKNSNDLNNVKIGGFYLQKILNNTIDRQERINSLKLQGYSNSSENILEKVDSSYMDSKVIKSMKVSNNGFYAYSKVISDENIDKLSNLVKDKINEASLNIIDGKFDINPKEMNGKNIGCKYCKYKDICYMKHKDTIILKELKNILEEDNNANVD